MESVLGSNQVSQKLLLCANCPKVFKTKNHLQKHMKRHSEKEAVPQFPCTQCGKLFKNRQLTHLHEKLVHGEKKFRCSQCERLFCTKAAYQKHDCNHKARKFEYNCDQCMYVTENKSKLNAHMRKVHKKNYKTYFCSICEEGFVRRFNVKLHIRKLHSGEDTYININNDLFHQLRNLKSDDKNDSNVYSAENRHLIFIGEKSEKVVNNSDISTNRYIENNDLTELPDMFNKSYYVQETKNIPEDETESETQNDIFSSNEHANYNLETQKDDTIKDFIKIKLEEQEESIKNVDFNKISITLSVPATQRFELDGGKDNKNYVKLEDGLSLNDVYEASNNLVDTFTKAVLPDIKIEDIKEENSSISKTKGQFKEHEQSNKTYECLECEKVFLYKDSLRVHKRIHTGEKPYKRDQCGKSFSHMSPYKTHQTTHTDEKPYICDTCGEAFKIKQSYVNHMRLHEGDARYQCDECEKQCTTKQKLEAHKKFHSGEKPYVCDVCGKAFSQFSRLQVHVRLHTGEKPYLCKICGDTFSDSTKLKVHIRNHTGEMPYKCNICEKKFTKLSNFKVHMRVHDMNKTHTCFICGELFSVYKELKIHKKTHKLYKCTDCDKSFEKERGLFTHKVKEHSIRIKGEPLICPECGKEFEKQNHFQKHTRRHALAKAGDVFPCTSCSKQFKSKELVRMHEKYVHGEKKLQCDNCLRWFRVTRELKQHKCKIKL